MTDILPQLTAALADRYAIERELGSGGMATVYLAHDAKHGRKVALKVLRPELAAALGHERFLREITTTAALHHPHVLALYDSGEADGLLYYVMPYVEGESLRDRLDREKQLPLDDTLSIAREVADALNYAHQRGVVHRDIKPENILLQGGHAQVADFGIARAVSAAGGEKLTQTGMVVGTPLYMSPEQAAGDAADARSDQYSLACVVYEMLAGHPPFSGPTALALIARHTLDPVPPLTTTRPSLPAHVAAAIERALAKAPADRFATMLEWLNAMQMPADDAASVVGSRSGPPTPEAVAARAETRTPLIGRDEEHAELDRMLAKAAGGHGGLVLLGGEPGVGKTRLAQELLADGARRGMLALIGHAYEDGGVPFITGVEILEEMARLVPPADLRRRLGHEASELARLMPDLRRRFPDIADPVELPPEQQRRYLFNSVLAFFTRASREQSMVMLLDDLHWADESSLLLLEHLAPHLSQIALLMLGTYRDVELDVGKPFEKTLARLVRQKLARRLAIRRLDEGEVAQLVAAFAGAEPPPSLAAAIHHETEGNPFFVTEVLQHFSEEGGLFDAEGRFRTNLVTDELDVPEGVRLVVGRRLERLGAETLKLLTTAAVIGRRFSSDLLEAVAGYEAETVIDGLEKAHAARLVSPIRGSREARYEFVHELIRHTLLGTLAIPRQQRIHLRVADALEAQLAVQGEERATELAHHLYQAGAAADAQKTIRYLVLAAERALQASASEEALRWLDSVETMGTPLTPAQRGELLFLRGLAERGLGRWTDFERDWTAALEIYEKTRADDARLARMASDLSYHLFLADQPLAAVEIVEGALRAVSDDSARCQLQGAAGFVHGLAGQPERAEQLLAEAADLAQRLGDRALTGLVLSYRMQHQWAYLRAREATDTGLRAAELIRAAGSPWQLSNCLALTLMALHWSARLVEASQLAEELETLSARVPDHGASATVSITRLFARIAQGRLDEAEPLAARCLEQVTRAGFPSHGHDYQGMVLFWRGRWDDAWHSVQQAVAGERGDAWRGWDSAHLVYVESYLARARGAASRTETERANELLRARVSLLPEAGRLNPVGSWGLALAMIEAASVLGERDLAAELLPLARDALAAGAEFAFSFGLVRKLLGIAAAAAGLHQEAEEQYRAALRQAHELPHRIEGAEVRRWYAQTLLERGEASQARALLGEARVAYEQTGMPRHVAIVDAMLKGAS